MKLRRCVFYLCLISVICTGCFFSLHQVHGYFVSPNERTSAQKFKVTHGQNIPSGSPQQNTSSSTGHRGTWNDDVMSHGRDYFRPMCNPVEDIFNNNTRPVTSPPGYRLARVYVVTRHGERLPRESPFKAGSDGCRLRYFNFTRDQKQLLKSYAEHVAQHSELGKGGIIGQSPVPWARGECAAASLTSYGLLQHVYLGKMLRRHYFSEREAPGTKDVEVYSTWLSRTLNSAKALLHGLNPSLAYSDVSFSLSNSIKFNNLKTEDKDYLCKCSYSASVDSTDFSKRLKTVKELIRVEKELSNAWGFKVHATSLLENAWASICHGLELPCYKDQCVTLSQLEALYRGKKHRYWHHYKSEEARRKDSAPFLPFLRFIVQSMVQESEKNSRFKLVLFSAHDVTMGPLNLLLGFREPSLVPYAAYLALELWVPTSPDSKTPPAVKVRWQGRDVSFDLTPCQGQGRDFCPLGRWVKFTSDSVFGQEGLTYKSLCY